jgi:hypothetical protein
MCTFGFHRLGTWLCVTFIAGSPTFRPIGRERTMISRDVTLEVANRSNPRHKIAR